MRDTSKPANGNRTGHCDDKRQQVIALGRLGWPLRRIERETGVRRETAGAYLKAAGIAVRPSGAWGRRSPAKPVNEVSPDPGTSEPARRVTASHCEAFLEFIELSLAKGRNAKAIWQDLVDDHGFTGRYASVKRFVRRLPGSALEPRGVIVTPPGEKAQVDYGARPMVRDVSTGPGSPHPAVRAHAGIHPEAIRLLVWRSKP